MIKITIGSLFSGIGGIEIGFERQGFTTEWFVEKDIYARTILKKRFPKAHIYDDITKIDFTTIPKVDLLTGGFPCQDISNAGQRTGIKGSRSSLWKYYLKAISEIRPQIAFIENVAALLGRGMSTVLSDLAKIGYDAEWHCVSASAVGALHRRDRVFIIAWPNEAFSNPSSIRLYTEENKQELEGKGCREFHISESRINEDISNTHITRQQRRRKVQMGHKELPNTPERRNNRKQCKKSIQEKIQRGYWAAEPELGRVANGVPNRMDRIKCLGNAVVPQVAEVFAESIKNVLLFRNI